MPEPLEHLARPVILGLIEEIGAYTNPVNDGRLASWMMAETRAKALLRAIQDTVRDIDTRSRSTFEEDVEAAKPQVHPVFAKLMAPFSQGA